MPQGQDNLYPYTHGCSRMCLLEICITQIDPVFLPNRTAALETEIKHTEWNPPIAAKCLSIQIVHTYCVLVEAKI